VGRDTYYDILGVSSVASPEEIKAKYRNLILRIHPDVDGPAALFRQVQKAYEVLSDPARRASYDRLLLLESRGRLARSLPDPTSRWYREPNEGSSTRGAQHGRDPRSADSASYGQHIRRANSPGRGVTSVLRLRPAGALAMAGAMLLVFGAALAEVRIALILLGVAALIIAGVAGLGGRGVKEREAFQRSGMTAVDAMTGRQFESLLEHFFAHKGYRVARIGGRGEFGADLLVEDGHGRMVVQARRWNRLVNHEAVQHAVAAMAHYGATRALVVTSSDYSEHAITVANSNGVTLWNRATLAAELTSFRGEPFQSGVKRLSSELRAGSCICLGLVAGLIVALVAKGTKERRLAATKRRR
jgi:curved DNA-binding protein CbpA